MTTISILEKIEPQAFSTWGFWVRGVGDSCHESNFAQREAEHLTC